MPNFMHEEKSKLKRFFQNDFLELVIFPKSSEKDLIFGISQSTLSQFGI
jgi:hypothetical protein